MNSRQVSERLGIREFLALCSTIDLAHGVGKKFEVIKIDRGETTIRVMVLFSEGELEDLQIAKLAA